jgi:two-component system cell cycle response regulator
MIRKTFEELKLSGNLPSPAGVGMKILQITRTENYSADEMGEAIMADPSLTGRILKLANTASNSGLEPATTVSCAIMRLGGRTVRDLALAFSLISERNAGTCRGFDYEMYWSRSLARAVCAQVVTRALGVGKPEEAYICGLLAEVGRLALASLYTQEYAELIASGVSGEHSALLEREEASFNITHAQVGACMLSDWGLPSTFAEAVESCCNSRELATVDEGISGLTPVLRFAHVLAEACVADERTRNKEWVRIGEGMQLLRRHLGMDPEEFTSLCDTCVTEWQAWGESLDIATHKGLRFKDVFARARSAVRAIERGDNDDSTEEAAGARGYSPSSQGTGRFKVLAVDDDPVALEVLIKYLTSEGYDVVSARSGKEGLRVALSEIPELVIADWEMPGMEGTELCRALRKTDVGRSMYFLLLTGTESEEHIVEAFDSGADDFASKPFIPRLLGARIQSGIRLAQMQRKIEEDKHTRMKHVAELGVLTRKLRSASLTDVLTELPNRRYCMKRLENEWASIQRTDRPLSVVMLDIDKFKDVNDDYGHDVGDLVLKETAAILQDSIRASDEVCRLGGEEFLIIATNTDEQTCRVLAERVRAAMEASIVNQAGTEVAVTVSLGVACSLGGYGTMRELLKAADEAVYLAKNSGRNQVRGSSELELERDSA